MIRHRLLWASVIAVGLAVAASGQESKPTFEVASVRRATPGETGGRIQFLPGGRFLAQNVAIQFVIEQVYGVRDFQIIAEPKWRAIIADGRENRYYLEGRGPEGATRQQLQDMVKTLLAERFGLKLRVEQRPLPVYALVVAERGVKGAQPRVGNPGGIALIAPGWIEGKRVAPSQIAQVLSRYVDRPVADLTKLDQFLEFTLTFTPPDLAAGGVGPSDPGCPEGFRTMAERLGRKLETLTCPSIFTAVEEQLGLKLQPQAAPLDVLVIDEIHPPTEN